MIEYQHPVLQKGRYQVVALTSGPEYDASAVTGYALVTGSGARIWQDLSFEEARLRLDAVAEQDALGPFDAAQQDVPDVSSRRSKKTSNKPPRKR